jgi:hypothetical protein
MFSVLLVIVSLITFVGLTGIYADENDPDVDNEAVENGENGGETGETQPLFQNAAQEQKAHNIVHALSLAAAIAKAEETGDEADIENAETALATESGVTVESIADMRGQGMGWGQIALSLGLHPSVLGAGHSKAGKEPPHIAMRGHNKSEMEEAAARGYQTGHSKGHDLEGKAASGKGLGLAHARGQGEHPGKGLALGHGKAAGSGNAASLSGNHGNGPGHGPGNSNGHGGGNGGGNK